jgi:nucleotide-binding universal stress UspA family protein
MAMGNVVVGVDGSTTSWRAFSLAVAVAKNHGARVRACLVCHTPASLGMAPFVTPMVPLVGECDDGGELGKQVRQELALAGVEGDLSCREGDIAQELEVLAESCRADMIVVGRSRHPALHLGGVPRRLLAMARRPVLVVP